MTGKKFFLFLLLQWVFFTLVKIWIFNNATLGVSNTQNWIFWIITAIASVAIVRRFGVISYFEVIAVVVAWLLVDLFLDLIITSNYTGAAIFKTSGYWFGYLAMVLAVMIFHKKRHVHIRKEQAKHHGHH